MSRSFVVDASVALAWVHPAQSTKETDAMLHSLSAGVRPVVPALWPLEVANALAVLVRRGKLLDPERQAALRWLRGLSFDVDHESAAQAFTRLSDLAAAHSLSVYDTAYLELAQRRGLALACKDAALRKAAAKEGVELWNA